MVSLLVLLQIILLVLVLRLMSRADVSRLLSTALLFYALLWYVIPITLGLALGRNLLLETLASKQVFVEFAIIETIALIVTLLFLFRRKPYFGSIVRQSIGHLETGPKPEVLIVLLAGIVISYVVDRQFAVFLGTAYLAQTAAPMTSLGEEWFGTYGSLGFVQSLMTAFAYLCLIIKWPRRNLTYFLVMLSALALTIDAVLVAVLGGARIAMMTFPLLLAMRAREHDWPVRKILVIALGLSIVVLPAAGSLTVAIAELRQREFTVEGLVMYSQDLLSNTGDLPDLEGAVIDQVVGKFDSISTGAFLVEASGAGFAGWKPYQGAFTAVIPRRILPDKPVPGSVDGTFGGHPSRFVPTLAGFGSNSASMGVSPAATAIWQLGFGGLIFLVIANVFNLYLANSLLLSSSLAARTIGISMLGIPALVTLFASPDVLIMNAERALIIYIITYLTTTLLIDRSNRMRTLEA